MTVVAYGVDHGFERVLTMAKADESVISPNPKGKKRGNHHTNTTKQNCGHPIEAMEILHYPT